MRGASINKARLISEDYALNESFSSCSFLKACLGYPKLPLKNALLCRHYPLSQTITNRVVGKYLLSFFYVNFVFFHLVLLDSPLVCPAFYPVSRSLSMLFCVLCTLLCILLCIVYCVLCIMYCVYCILPRPARPCAAS